MAGEIGNTTGGVGGWAANFVNAPQPIEKKFTSTELQAFSYYSGSQISVWFGDIWVDDIFEISWQYNQSKSPIYGYASQYFDSMAKGQVIIQGSFTINFREKGYMSYIVNNLPKLESSIKTSISGNNENEKWAVIRSVISSHLRSGTFGPRTTEQIIVLAEKDDFFEEAELYEQAIWGTDEKSGVSPKYIDTPDILQQKEFPEGFNVLITYGNVSASEATSYSDMTNSTAKSLSGVHLLGSSQVIRSNGEPTLEAYSFIAKGMDDYVGTSF